jgi:ABC-type nitrate/sulfonate/bicarbonate transport system ATPase subunit
LSEELRGLLLGKELSITLLDHAMKEVFLLAERVALL